MHGGGQAGMRDERKYVSFYLLLQDDGQTLGGNQKQHREEVADGLNVSM